LAQIFLHQIAKVVYFSSALWQIKFLPLIFFISCTVVWIVKYTLSNPLNGIITKTKLSSRLTGWGHELPIFEQSISLPPIGRIDTANIINESFKIVNNKGTAKIIVRKET
jgi:hypothetical protein